MTPLYLRRAIFLLLQNTTVTVRMEDFMMIVMSSIRMVNASIATLMILIVGKALTIRQTSMLTTAIWIAIIVTVYNRMKRQFFKFLKNSLELKVIIFTCKKFVSILNSPPNENWVVELISASTFQEYHYQYFLPFHQDSLKLSFLNRLD